MKNPDFSNQGSKNRSKRANSKKNFVCSCGKAYMNYSSLYVHAMVKHNIKLSSKITVEDHNMVDVNQALQHSDRNKCVQGDIGMENGDEICDKNQKNKVIGEENNDQNGMHIKCEEIGPEIAMQKKQQGKKCKIQGYIGQLLQAYSTDFEERKRTKMTNSKKQFLKVLCQQQIIHKKIRNIDCYTDISQIFFKQPYNNSLNPTQKLKNNVNKLMNSELLTQQLHIESKSAEGNIFSNMIEDFLRWTIMKQEQNMAIRCQQR